LRKWAIDLWIESRELGGWCLWLAAIAAGVVLPAVPVGANELRGAAGVVDITPPLGIQLGGYEELRPDRPAKGIRDPLTARILVLNDGRRSAAFVVADLIGTFATAEMEQIRASVKAEIGIEWLFFSVTHSHSAPAMQEQYPAGTFPEWEQQAIRKIVAGVGEAARRLEAVRVGTGWGQTDIGHNRRFVRGDGSVRMLWRNSTRVATYPVDTSVGVLRVDNARGAPIAILVNYACHPVVFTADNDFYSADYPGVTRRYVERNLKGSPICLFLQGAAGNINPYFDKTYLDEDAAEMVHLTGERLGKEVVRVARQVETTAPTTSEVACLADTRHFKLRWDPKDVRKHLTAVLTPEHVEQSMRSLRTEFTVPVASCVIDREIAFAAFPGEFFVEFQQQLRSRSPLRDTFFLGYTNGYFGYFPTIRAAATGGYGAADFSVLLEPGAGERLIDQALIQIYRLMGKLKDQPLISGD
jgi:neutral ceramidase